MGSRPARRLCAVALTASTVAFAAPLMGSTAHAATWGVCDYVDDDCPRFYLNVAARQGEARFSVDRTCRGGWRHAWSRADARHRIRQWLNGRAAAGAGGLCIALAPQVNEVRIAPLGGHCGYEDGEANQPAPGVTLKAGYRGRHAATLAGCHARIGGQDFGGIALRFADGFGFGDAYATGYFYGVYDGFRRRRVSPADASVWRISQFNTYHYRVEVLANGSPDWRANFMEENDD